jgi:hypothetical protein
MKRLLLAAILAVLVLGVSSPLALAGGGNPSGTGPPSQSCQEIEGEGGTVPGHSSSSPGSPFNEPEINSEEGGRGGAALQREVAVRRRLLPRLAESLKH